MDIVRLLAIPLLILVNGLFVAIEFALVAIRKTRVEQMRNEGISGAESIEEALSNLDRSIAGCQLGITLASIALGAVGEPALAHLVEPLFSFLPDTWTWISKHSLATIVALLSITCLHVILGEQVPKMAAIQSAERMALWLARPLNLFSRVTKPIISLMNAVGNWLLRRMGYQTKVSEGAVHSPEELQMLIEDTEEAGLLDSEQARFLINVFALTDKTVRECMIPRDRLDALDISASSEEVLEKVRECGHTRLPVYQGDLNNIVGILNTKNLFYFFSLKQAVVLDDALYPPLFLDADEQIATAMRLFKKQHRHMAIVREKDGTVVGLITLEDILEEIVGDIEDEHDDQQARVRRTQLIRRIAITGMTPRVTESQSTRSVPSAPDAGPEKKS